MKDSCVFALWTCLVTFCYAKFAMSFSRATKSRTACENQLDIPHYNEQLELWYVSWSSLHWFIETVISHMLVNVRTSQERFQASQNMTTFSPSSKLRLAWKQALVTSPSIRAFFHPRISLGTWVTLGEERFAGCHVRGNFSWRLPLFAWKQLRDTKEAIGRGSYGLVCATFGDEWATRSSVFVQNLCNMPWHPFRVLGFGSFSAIPCFRI